MPEHSRAFTLIELMAVVLILAILAGVALPKFFDYQTAARESACKGALGGIRAGLANFYANRAIVAGVASYPTLTELTAIGSVMNEVLPDNPYAAAAGIGSPNGVVAASLAESVARTVVDTTNGWAYYPGSATTGAAAVFYANTDSDDGTVDENDF